MPKAMMGHVVRSLDLDAGLRKDVEMPDVIETLASEGGRELVKALAAGLVELVKKVPGLWRRSGKDTEERMAAELERSAGELAAAQGDEAAVARVRAEATWETRLRDLLAADPEARLELERILHEIRQENSQAPHLQQNVTASGQNSVAQGVIGGNIHNYGGANPGDAAGGRR